MDKPAQRETHAGEVAEQTLTLTQQLGVWCLAQGLPSSAQESNLSSYQPTLRIIIIFGLIGTWTSDPTDWATAALKKKINI